MYVVDCSLLLLPLINYDTPGSPVAFNAILSITAIGFQVSYGIPIFLRCTVGRQFFRKSSYHNGALSLPLCYAACLWLFTTSFFMFFPQKYPITSANMNYAPVVVLAVALLAGGYWLAHARFSFRGPKRVHESLLAAAAAATRTATPELDVAVAGDAKSPDFFDHF